MAAKYSARAIDMMLAFFAGISTSEVAFLHEAMWIGEKHAQFDTIG